VERPALPFTEIQCDLFSSPVYDPKTGKIKRNDSGVSYHRVLVAVDVTSRYIMAGRLPYRTPSTLPGSLAMATAHLLLKIVPDEWKKRIKVVRTDDGNEFSDQHFWEHVKNHFSNEVVHQKVNKARFMMSAPGVMAPAETAVRTVREYLEKYRRLQDTDVWHTLQFQTMLEVYNHQKHSAFHNKYSPNDMVKPENEAKLLAFLMHTRLRGERDAQAMAQNKLKVKKPEGDEEKKDPDDDNDGNDPQPPPPPGDGGAVKEDVVRVIRIQDPKFKKQSYPTLSYDTYKVTKVDNNVEVHLVNQRTGEPLLRPVRGGNVKKLEPGPVHISRIARVKHPVQDPPAGTAWGKFLVRVRSDIDGKAGDHDMLASQPVRGQPRHPEVPVEHGEEEMDIDVRADRVRIPAAPPARGGTRRMTAEMQEARKRQAEAKKRKRRKVTRFTPG
jgi:hypothetical protein